MRVSAKDMLLWVCNPKWYQWYRTATAAVTVHSFWCGVVWCGVAYITYNAVTA